MANLCKLKWFAIGLVALILMSSVLVFATSAAILNVEYGIKLLSDGKPLILKDSVGANVDPFVYNGTTYVPLRFIANKLGRDVAWDSASNSVNISNPKGIVSVTSQETTLKAEDLAVVELLGNPTTGYTWEYKISDPEVLVLESGSINPTNTSEGIVGAPSSFAWRFRALKAGNCTVEFTYRRSWEPPSSTDKTEKYNFIIE